MFFGFNTALRGLTASQRALYTTGHNIDNMSTPGYSRQLVDQNATTAYRLPGIGYIGTGTEITDIKRARDAFVDYKYWNEQAPFGEWSIKNESLTELEKIMGEPTDSSFRQYLDDFFTSLEDLSKNVKDPSFREPVRENAKSFAKHINEIAKRLENHKEDLFVNLQNKVDQINQIASQIASLNRQIYTQEIDGTNANDLRDSRDLLVDQLSEIVDVRVTESPNGHHDVSIGGNSLVNHFNHSSFKIDRKALEAGDSEGSVLWDNSSPVNFKSGELKGLVDLITGNGEKGSYRGIVFYEDYLNEFAKGFADKINAQHEKGFNLKGETGIKFFQYDESLGAAATLNLSDAILESVDNIAAGGIDGAAEDNQNLLKLIDLREDRNFFNNNKFPIGTPDDFIKSMLSSLAVDTLQTERFTETQGLLKNNLENKRSSISGVQFNEEMSNIVKYQQIYVASSKMITTLDTLLDVTVNNLGLVGR